MDSLPPTASVLSGIDLLMNPKKRANSEASSRQSSAGSQGGRGPSGPSGPPDATVRDLYADDAYLAPPPPPPPPPMLLHHQHQSHPAFYKAARPPPPHPHPPAPASVYGSSASSSSYEEDDGDDGDGDDDGDDGDGGGGGDDDDDGSGSGSVQQERRRMSPEQEANAKRDVLYQFDRIERKGVRLPRRFTMDDPLDEMRAELERLKIDRELDISVRFQRKMLMTCVTGIEMLNGKFDPFDVKLDGWSDAMHEQANDYDEVFEELHMKYRGKAKMAPELKLMFMVGGSGVMFHLTSSMFRQSQMPGLEQVMRRNPALARQVQQATMAEMQQQQQQQQPANRGGGGGGGIFGMLSGLMGGGSRSASPPPPPPPPPPQQQQQYQQQQQQPQNVMRGPKHVDEILRDLHRDTFQQQQQNFSRVEIISNASESELGDLPDDAASALLGDPVPAPAPPPQPAARQPRKAAARGGK